MSNTPEFTTPIEAFNHRPRIVDGEIQRKQVVLESIVVWLDTEDNIVTVPKGFVCDLASIPWFTGFMLNALGRHQRAAVLHDWLYRNRVRSKGYCDKQFNDAMKYDGVKLWRRAAIIAGLKIGGRISWHTKSEVEIIHIQGRVKK